MPRQNPIYLDKVERKKLAELRDIKPEYADLKIGQIAHVGLKQFLFFEIKETLKNNSATPVSNAALVQAGYKIWYGLVRKFTIFIYKFQNRFSLCANS